MNMTHATGAIVPPKIACTCPPGFCLGVPGDDDGESRVCRACMALDPETDCIREWGDE